MSDLPMIGLRQFRQKLDEQESPVRVVKTRGDITFLGTWIPAQGWEVQPIAGGSDHGGYKIVPTKEK